MNQRRIAKTSSIGLVVLAAIFQSPRATAAKADRCEQHAECSKHLSSGLQAYADGNFRKALSDFQVAYEHSQEPRILLDVGRSLHRLGRHGEALDRYASLRKQKLYDPALEQTLGQYEDEAKAGTSLAASSARTELRPHSAASVQVGPVTNQQKTDVINIVEFQVSATPTLPVAPAASALSISATPAAVTSRPVVTQSVARRPWFWGLLGSGVAIGVSALVAGIALRPFDESGSQPFGFGESQRALLLQRGGKQ